MNISKVKEWIEAFIFAFFFAIIMFFICWPVLIDGASMEETFYHGDRVMISRAAIYLGELQRGDIYVFDAKINGEDKHIIKRLIAIPGDSVHISDGIVFVNDEKIEEAYINDQVTKGDIDLVLEEDQYFILGDNREVSLDSRKIGPLSKSDILGKVFIRIYPFNKIELY